MDSKGKQIIIDHVDLLTMENANKLNINKKKININSKRFNNCES